MFTGTRREAVYRASQQWLLTARVLNRGLRNECNGPGISAAIDIGLEAELDLAIAQLSGPVIETVFINGRCSMTPVAALAQRGLIKWN